VAGGLVAVAHSCSQPDAQGQRRGRCRTSRRPVVAIRPGMLMVLVRSVAQRAVRIAAATAVARAMLNAITACAIQDALAAYFPDGRCASGPSLSGSSYLRWGWVSDLA